MRSTKTSSTICPSYAVRIHFDKLPHLGDVIVCPECEETIEVVRLEPLKINRYLLDDEPSWADIDIEDYEDRYDRPVSNE